MKLDWMGRYRELVRALIHYSNCSNRSRIKRMEKIDDDISLSKYEYQILEYILEFEDETRILADISRDLGVMPCTVTTATKRLLSLGLIERYRIKGNKKSIILKPTAKGAEIHQAYRTRDIQKLFLPFFSALETLSDEDLAAMEKAVRALSQNWGSFNDELLEKMS